MRTGATQSSPTASPKVTATVGIDVHTTEGGGGNDRLARVLSDEQVWGGEYIIELDNSDSALSAKTYEGDTVIINFGFTDQDGSNLHYLTVDSQRFISREGRLLLQLHCIDRWSRLAFYTASLGGSLWNHPSQTMTRLNESVLPSGEDIPDALKTAINSQYDKTIEDIVDKILLDTLGAVATPETGHDDPNYYNKKPAINADDARSAIIQAMQGCSSYLRLKVNQFEVVNPTKGTLAYSYNVADLFFNNLDENALVRPNTIRYHGVDSGGNLIVTQAGHGENAASIAKIGTVYEHHFYDWADIEDIVTQGDVDAYADARINRLVAGLSTGNLVAPMHCSQELFDKIEVVDDRYTPPKTITGYVFRIIREYDRGIYRITITLGGVETYYTPEGGNEVKVEPFAPSPSPPLETSVAWEDILPQAIQGYYHDISFSAVDWDMLSWSSGTIKFYDGTTQAVSAGSCDLPDSSIRYIYFDLNDANPNILKVATSYTAIMTESTGLLCLVQRGSATGIKCRFIPSYGKEPLITADWIDMTGLKEYDYGGGAKLQAILSTQIQNGHILLSAETFFSPGYDPTGKEVLIHRGATAPLDTTKLWFDTSVGLMKAYVAGQWKVLEGEWYRKTGVAIDATKGLRLYGGGMSLITYPSLSDYLADTNRQCYVGTDGKIYAGAGAVVMDASGLTVVGDTQMLRIRYTFGTPLGSIFAGSDRLRMESADGLALLATTFLSLSSNGILTVQSTNEKIKLMPGSGYNIELYGALNVNGYYTNTLYDIVPYTSSVWLGKSDNRFQRLYGNPILASDGGGDIEGSLKASLGGSNNLMIYSGGAWRNNT